MAWVDTLPGLDPAQAAVLGTMARYVSDETMVFYGSLSTVARVTRYSRGNVQRTVRRLEDMALLVLVRAERGRSRHYRLSGISAPKFAPLAPDHPDDMNDLDGLDGTLWTTIEPSRIMREGVAQAARGVDNNVAHHARGGRAYGARGSRMVRDDTDREGFERDSGGSRSVDNLTVQHDRTMWETSQDEFEAPSAADLRAEAKRVHQVDDSTRATGLEALARIRAASNHAKKGGL